MKRLLILFSVFIFTVSGVWAINIEWKEGYVVNGNDTLHGEVGLHSSENDHFKILFRKDTNSSPVTYFPNDLSAYGTNEGLVFVSKNVSSATIEGLYFVVLLFRGTVDLYYLEIPDKDISHYIVSREEGERDYLLLAPEDARDRNIARKRIQTTMSMLLGDSPEIQAKINNLSGSRMSMIGLLQDYERIVSGNSDEAAFVFAQSKPKRKHFISPYAGVGYSNLLSEIDNWVGEKTTFSPLIGADYSFNLDRFSSKWLMHISLDMGYINQSNSRALALGKQIVDFKFSAIEFTNKIGVEYRLLTTKVIPSFNLGFFHKATLGLESEMDFFYASDLDYQKYTGGFFVGAGVYIPLKNGCSIPVKIDYNRNIFGNEITDYRCVFYNYSWRLSVGYTFNL